VVAGAVEAVACHLLTPPATPPEDTPGEDTPDIGLGDDPGGR